MIRGMMANPKGIKPQKTKPIALIAGVYFGCLKPRVWKALWKPWNKWKPKAIIEIT